MGILDVQSFAVGQWISPDASARSIENAVTGDVMARAGSGTLDVVGMLEYARTKGGPALRAMNFHDRARMLKALALHLKLHRKALYQLSFETGATLADSKIDIDGGIATLLVYASKGRREMPEDFILPDGELEFLSRDGSFLGQHVYTPLRGVAVQINAFNFPVWGMLEKLAPTLLAGVPAIDQTRHCTRYVTELA